MAIIHLHTAWLNLASDLSQKLVIQFATQIDPQPKTAAEFRSYGQNRWRLATTGATQRSQVISAVAVTPAELALLRAWTAKTVLYRDDSGEKFYGAYLDPQIKRHQYDVNADVSFTVMELTHSEVV